MAQAAVTPLLSLSSASTATTLTATSLEEAPVAGLADQLELDVEEVGAERGRRERHDGLHVPGELTAQSGGDGERQEPEQAQARDRQAQDLGVARALHGLAAARGADDARVGVPRVEEIRRDGGAEERDGDGADAERAFVHPASRASIAGTSALGAERTELNELEPAARATQLERRCPRHAGRLRGAVAPAAFHGYPLRPSSRRGDARRRGPPPPRPRAAPRR